MTNVADHHDERLLRGLEKMKGEWSLICTAHNLLKPPTSASFTISSVRTSKHDEH